MTRTDEQYATLEERDGRGVVRLERRLAATPEEVWPLLVEPEEVASWLCGVVIEPRVGGVYDLSCRDMRVSRGHITTFEPPTLLEFTWYEGEPVESLVRFELRPVDTETTDLIVTHTLRQGASNLHLFATGWHAHLDLLIKRLAGHASDWDSARYDALLAAYRAREAGDA